MTNEEALKKGLKEVENLGILAPAILRERLLALCEMNLKQIKANPKPYNNFFYHARQYEQVLQTFIETINFK